MGMSRHDLKELGESLDKGQAGLIVVGIADQGAHIEAAMKNAEKVDLKELQADNDAIEADATTTTHRPDHQPTQSTENAGNRALSARFPAFFG